jgi:hypothetical protein
MPYSDGQQDGIRIEGTLSGTIVPEPGTLMLLVSALLGLAGAVYLRRRGAKA